MKRVKVMLSAVFVMAIVAGALAFKAKSPDVCVYQRIFTTTTGTQPTTIGNCSLVSTLPVASTTAAAPETIYAKVLAPVNDACPTTTTVCDWKKSIVAE